MGTDTARATETTRLVEIDTHAPGWGAEVDRLRGLLGAPHNPLLFPPHYLKATFMKIGGRVVSIVCGDQLVGVGFLFPRALQQDGSRCYTLRLHPVEGTQPVDEASLADQLQALLAPHRVTVYHPAVPHHFAPTSTLVDGLDYGAPNAAEAEAIRALQHGIWGSEPDFLYPADLHSPEFGSGTSLVVRDQSRLVGFLFGLSAFSDVALPEVWQARFGSPLCLESQLLGVLPEYRGRGVAYQLKRLQAERAREQGVARITWTVDPLQFSNAVLNFGRLRALAYEFAPDFYAFRNDLNRVPAARFSVTWLVQSQRVLQALAAPPDPILDLRADQAIHLVNDGHRVIAPPGGAARIAVEIPLNWTALQQTQPDEAVRWREATATVFHEYLGATEGKYVMTAVARCQERVYLVGERVTSAVLEALGS